MGSGSMGHMIQNIATPSEKSDVFLTLVVQNFWTINGFSHEFLLFLLQIL